MMQRKNRLQVVAVCGVAALIATSASAVEWEDERTARGFDVLDTDHNGQVSADEFRAGIEDDKSRAEAQEIFRRLDADNNGSISPAEARTQWAAAKDVLRDEIYEHNDASQATIQGYAFSRLDTNGDQFLSRAEFEACVKADATGVGNEFTRTDDNQDDRLSRDEFNEDWTRFRKIMRAELLYSPRAELDARLSERQRIVFVSLDSNGDGFLDVRECRLGLVEQNRSEAVFAALDTNGDNVLSRAEMIAGWPKLHSALRADLAPAKEILVVERRDATDKLFEQLDANGDGRLTVQEYQGGTTSAKAAATLRFEVIDTNNDGYVDRGELRDARSQ